MNHPSIRLSSPASQVEHPKNSTLDEITLLSEKVGLRDKVVSLLEKQCYDSVRDMVRREGEALAAEMNKQPSEDKGPYSFDSILTAVPSSDEKAARLMNLQKIFMLTRRLRATQT